MRSITKDVADEGTQEAKAYLDKEMDLEKNMSIKGSIGQNTEGSLIGP